MRTLSLALLCWLLSLGCTLGASSTNEWSVCKHQGRRQAYEWRISEARVASTPGWNINADKIPLAPDKAWRIARQWFKEQGRPSPDLLRIEIRPFLPDIDLSADQKPQLKTLLGKYYYRIEVVPAQFDSMIAIVLMDGTVLEPVLIPNLRPEEIK